MYYCYYHYCICIYIGAETTAKLTKMKVLIYGLRGIGVETCKNLALQGVGAITVSGDDAVVDVDNGGDDAVVDVDDDRDDDDDSMICYRELRQSMYDFDFNHISYYYSYR